VILQSILLLMTLAIDTTYINITGENSFCYYHKFLLTEISPPGYYPFTYKNNESEFNINGMIKGLVQIEGEVHQERVNNRNSVYFKMGGKGLNLSLGDISVSMGKEIMLNRHIRGIKGGVKYQKFESEGFYSISYYNSYRDTIAGDGTSGPFFLTHSPIIEETEDVKIENGLQHIKLKRGTDYKIEYLSGRITLINSILDNDEIMNIEYEYDRENGQSIAGCKIMIKPFPFISLGGLFLNNRGYGFDSEIKTKYLTSGFEIVKDSNRMKAYSISNGVSTKYFDLKAKYRYIDDSFSLNGNYINHGKNINIESSITPFKKMNIKADYILRNNNNDFNINVFVMDMSYKFREYTGNNKLILHSLGIEKEINKILMKWNINFEKHDTLNIYKLKNKTSLNKKRYGFSMQSSYGIGDYNEWNIDGTLWLAPIKGINIATIGKIRRSGIFSPITLFKGEYRISSWEYLKMSGKYKIETIRREVSDTSEQGIRHSGYFKFILTPIKWINISFSPIFTKSKGIISQRIFNYSNNEILNMVCLYRYFRFIYYVDWKNNYSIDQYNVRTQDNKNIRNEIKLMYSPITVFSAIGGYSHSNGNGLYRITIPINGDTLSDTLYQFRKNNQDIFSLSNIFDFIDRSSVKIKYTKKKYSLTIPDSLPTITDEQKISIRGNRRILEKVSIYEEISYSWKCGFEPFIAGNNKIKYQTIGFETGVNVISMKWIKGGIFFLYTKSIRELCNNSKKVGVSLNISEKWLEFNGSGDYNYSSFPYYKTAEFNVNINIKF